MPVHQETRHENQERLIAHPHTQRKTCLEEVHWRVAFLRDNLYVASLESCGDVSFTSVQACSETTQTDRT